VALTLLHAGIPAEEPWIAKRIEKALHAPLGATYDVSLAAMLLEAADRQQHQARIAELAQILVENQCPDGEWSYGDRTRKEGDSEPESTGGSGSDQGGKPGGKPGTEVRKRIRLKPTGPKGPPHGDNSNTQFALLGLRAAEDALVEAPPETWTLAHQWFATEHKTDGGYGYHGAKGFKNDPSYGSMTAVAIASLAICDNYLKLDFASEPALPRALAWLGARLTFDENPADPHQGGTMHRQYYWIYSVERAGVLAKQERFGEHAWYAEGARWLLAKQDADGAWNGDPIDTCFAILFLKKATAPLKPRVYTPG
jgi:hypothetical protein